MKQQLSRIINKVTEIRAISALMGLLQRFERHDIIGMAAKTAYWLLISFFPLILLLLSITAGQELDIFEHIIPPSVISILEDVLRSAPKTDMTLFSSLMLLWSASTSIRAMMNGIYAVHTGRGHVQLKRGRLWAIIFTLLLTVFVYVCVSLTLVSGFAVDWVLEHFHWLNDGLIRAARILIITGLIFLFTMSLYAAIPGDGMTIRHTLCGAAASSFGWIIATWGFELYMTLFSNYSVLYGGVGAFLGLALWLFMIAVILFIGGEINALIFERRHKDAP